MKEHGIRFNAQMRAILEGHKTQTRRLMSKSDFAWWAASGYEVFDHPEIDPWPMVQDDLGDWIRMPSPHAVGDRLWVRETLYWDGKSWRYKADDQPVVVAKQDETAMLVWAHHRQRDYCSPLFMPRWASRITLEVTEVRAQRLQDISEEDAAAEGTEPTHMVNIASGPFLSYREEFRELWESINGRDSWAANPHVWAYTFKQESA